MKKEQIKIALIQMSMDTDIKLNLKKAKNYISNASSKNAKIICLPELFASQYFCKTEDHKYFDLAEPIPGPITNEISKLAAKLKVFIIVPLFEREMAGIYYNSLVLIDDTGNIAGKYRKVHIPDDPTYYEKFYFRPGNLGFKVFPTKYCNIGTLICWDQWFPEAARITTLMGADIIFYPTAIGYHPHEKEKYGATQLESWKTVQRGHSIANGVYVAACNRTGFEQEEETSNGLEFWGNSFISDPQGKILAQASSYKEEILFSEINLSFQEKVRQHWPFLRDRRNHLYEDIVNK